MTNPNVLVGGSESSQEQNPSVMIGDRYRTLKILGQGNFGRTYLAADESQPDKPLYAVKQFFPQTLGSIDSGEAATLFRQEAERLRELGKHPQIPALLEYFEQDGKQYIVQEFVDGSDLEHQLQADGPYSETQIYLLLKGILPVLQFVHEHRVIHRDIKPQNIIRRATDGQLVLVDFGAAKYATGTALAKTGTMIGTAAYIAPEQVMGRAVFSSDLYSLGVTCIHLLTGMNPFELMDHGQGGWVWQDYLTHPVSTKTSRIIDKLLQRGTQHRYVSAAAVLHAFEPPPSTSRVSAQNGAHTLAIEKPYRRSVIAKPPRRRSLQLDRHAIAPGIIAAVFLAAGISGIVIVFKHSGIDIPTPVLFPATEALIATTLGLQEQSVVGLIFNIYRVSYIGMILVGVIHIFVASCLGKDPWQAVQLPVFLCITGVLFEVMAALML